MSVRETVLKSLSAVGAQHEAKFYADLFARQEAESFAMIVVDPRCLKKPLLEALISAVRILSNLELTPVLIVGALEDERTSIKFQAQILSKALDRITVPAIKLNTATYGLIKEVRKSARAGKIPVLEMTDRRGKMNLGGLTKALKPNKIIFLQPSGGLSLKGKRRPNLTMQDLPELMDVETFSAGQIRFLDCVLDLDKTAKTRRSYVIASPLNLLGELFTTRGTGTLIRRAVDSIRNFIKASLRPIIAGALYLLSREASHICRNSLYCARHAGKGLDVIFGKPPARMCRLLSGGLAWETLLTLGI